jgi:hypothetical protein
MPFTRKGYERRAEECAKLAKHTSDRLVHRDLEKLKQTYLTIAHWLEGDSKGPGMDGENARHRPF